MKLSTIEAILLILATLVLISIAAHAGGTGSVPKIKAMQALESVVPTLTLTWQNVMLTSQAAWTNEYTVVGETVGLMPTNWHRIYDAPAVMNGSLVVPMTNSTELFRAGSQFGP